MLLIQITQLAISFHSITDTSYTTHKCIIMCTHTHTQSDKHTETAETDLLKAGAVKFDHSISQGPGIASGRVPDF